MDNKYYIIVDEEFEVLVKLKIHQTVNRPNNPDDYSLISDYMWQNFGLDTKGFDVIEFEELSPYQFIGVNYCIEV